MPDPSQLPPLPVLSNRFTGDYFVGTYTHNHTVYRYRYASGNLMQQVQGPAGTAAEVVNTDAPAGGLLVTFEVVRYGLMPLVPGVITSDSNVVLLDGDIALEMQLAQNGKDYWFGCAGAYAYGYKVPVWVTSAGGLPFPVTTVDKTDPANAPVLPQVAFVDIQKARKGQPAAGDSAAVLQQLVPKKPQ